LRIFALKPVCKSSQKQWKASNCLQRPLNEVLCCIFVKSVPALGRGGPVAAIVTHPCFHHCHCPLPRLQSCSLLFAEYLPSEEAASELQW